MSAQKSAKAAAAGKKTNYRVAAKSRTSKVKTPTRRPALSGAVTVADGTYERTVEPKFREMYDQWAKAQDDLAPSDLERLLDRIRAAIQPARHDLDDAIGPFYDTTGLRNWTGNSRQAIDGNRKRNSLIACQLEGRDWVYPTWQFDDAGSPRRDFVAIWRTLRGPANRPNADPWTCALWMRSPHPDLDDQTPVDWLSSGGEIETVDALARRDAARWAQ
ncbi:UNVERIFIED_ORG: uncharacterized protein DUF2384 [Dietzia maris]|uniref:hypothetical protein n=1 Tax=Dietzia maris TaxID=37915 RepID=UPI0010E18DBC